MCCDSWSSYYLLLNPRRGTLQTSKKSLTQSEESYSTLISNPEILIMLKNIRADYATYYKPIVT